MFVTKLSLASELEERIPARDALSFVIWIHGFFSDRITRRGLGYRVRKGRLFRCSIHAQNESWLIPASARLVSHWQ
jgi:hypothetical protein